MHLLKFRAISESLSVVGICISLTKDLQVGFAAFPNFFFFPVLQTSLPDQREEHHVAKVLQDRIG